jgi:hypothetical protein
MWASIVASMAFVKAIGSVAMLALFRSAVQRADFLARHARAAMALVAIGRTAST